MRTLLRRSFPHAFSALESFWAFVSFFVVVTVVTVPASAGSAIAGVASSGKVRRGPRAVPGNPGVVNDSSAP